MWFIEKRIYHTIHTYPGRNSLLLISGDSPSSGPVQSAAHPLRNRDALHLGSKKHVMNHYVRMVSNHLTGASINNQRGNRGVEQQTKKWCKWSSRKRQLVLSIQSCLLQDQSHVLYIIVTNIWICNQGTKRIFRMVAKIEGHENHVAKCIQVPRSNNYQYPTKSNKRGDAPHQWRGCWFLSGDIWGILVEESMYQSNSGCSDCSFGDAPNWCIQNQTHESSLSDIELVQYTRFAYLVHLSHNFSGWRSVFFEVFFDLPRSLDCRWAKYNM